MVKDLVFFSELPGDPSRAACEGGWLKSPLLDEDHLSGSQAPRDSGAAGLPLPSPSGWVEAVFSRNGEIFSPPIS